MTDLEGGDRLPPQNQPLEDAPQRQTTPFLVLQFFVFPMSIVAVCVAVFVVFGLIASEGKGPRDYVSEVRTGSANRRWQAAFELSKVLQARKDPALSDPRFVSELVALFEDAAKDDPRVRRYLALALGRLGDKSAVPSLVKAIRDAESGEIAAADSETQIYAVWALGSIGDASAVAELVRLAGSEDPGIRKTAVHALGVFPAGEARDAIAKALADPIDDVRWNAALALARRRDARAAPVLIQMMSRSYLDSVRTRATDGTTSGLSDEQKDDAILQAIGAAATLPEPTLHAALEVLRDGDPSLKVRAAARAALEGG